MDVFALRNHLISDYASYIQSFINIRDQRLKQFVDQELTAGAFWPNPLIQLNPNFEPGEWIDDLAQQGILQPVAKQIFRLDKPTNPASFRERPPNTRSNNITPANAKLPRFRYRLALAYFFAFSCLNRFRVSSPVEFALG